MIRIKARTGARTFGGRNRHHRTRQIGRGVGAVQTAKDQERSHAQTHAAAQPEQNGALALCACASESVSESVSE